MVTAFPTIEQLRSATTGHGLDDHLIELQRQVYVAINALESGGGGGGVATQDDGVPIDSPATTINVVGAGGHATGGAGLTTLTIPGSVKGLLGGRPAAAAANEGMIYHATDVPAIYVSDGATWTTVSIAKAQVTGLGTAAGNNTGDFQPIDADLTAIAALDASTSGAIASDGAGWIKKSYAQFKTALGLVKADVGLGSVDNTADAAKTLTGDVGGTLGATVIGAGKVTRAMEVNQAANSFRGNNTGSPATPIDMTVAQAKTLLAIAEADVSGLVADLALKAPIASPTFTGVATSPVFSASGLAGSTSGARFAGGVSGAFPASGTYVIGDYVVDQAGAFWVCILGGTPGIWTRLAGVTTDSVWGAKGDLLVATGNDTASRFAAGADGQALVSIAAHGTQGVNWGNPRSGAEAKLCRTSALTESMPRTHVNTVTVALTTQVVFLQAVYLPAETVITNLGWTSGTTAAGTPTNWWFTLCDSARKTLRSTADQTSTAWAASTEKVLALSSTFTTTYEGLHYIGIMMKATTPITLQTFASVATLIGQTPILCGASSTGQTTPPADNTTLTAITAAATPAYCYAA